MINFHDLNTGFKLSNKREIKRWMNEVAKTEKKEIGQLDIIFCSDNYLLDLNNQHLNHNYFTDILTFNYSDNQSVISGDLFISVDRVKENSIQFASSIELEIKRVMVHGLLHLIGYNDSAAAEKNLMKQKENFYLGT
jgi:probable rRNA maturation factor